MELKFDIFQTMALATIVFFIGKYMKNKISFFSKYCIPSPVIGGVLFSLIVLILKLTNTATITLDTTLQNIFMTVFFTSIGFTASFKVLKKGGIHLIIFLIISTLLIISQDILGVSLAKLFNLDPLLGLCTASIPMVGGHGTAGSFGPLFEGMGIKGATTVSFASATFGLVMGSLIGGIIAKNLIERYKIETPKHSDDHSIPVSDFHQENDAILSNERLMRAMSLIFIAMGIGSIISKFLQDLGLTFPSYIGAMLAAAIIRNICDIKKISLKDKEIEVIGNISLSFFLSMALMGLKLWELFDLALPMIIMLIGQTILMAFFAYVITFRAMGKDYEATVFASGLCGFGMGATPNAIANMDALTAKFGFAPNAYFTVPIVGCLFIDFINSTVITLFVNFIH